MNIKKFSFPKFEEWNVGREYKETIGTYTCAIRAFTQGCGGNTKNVYVAAVSPIENLLNVYAKKVLYDSVECDYFDEETLKNWYDNVTSTFNEKWERFLLETYFSN